MAENELPAAQPINPQELMGRFRGNYVNAHELRKREPKSLPKADIKTRKQKPIKENELPEGIRSRLQRYRQDHPGTKVELLKYQRIENGEPTVIVEDAVEDGEGGLPEEDVLLTLSQTVTLLTSTEAQTITEVIVAEITPA